MLVLLEAALLSGKQYQVTGDGALGPWQVLTVESFGSPRFQLLTSTPDSVAIFEGVDCQLGLLTKCFCWLIFCLGDPISTVSQVVCFMTLPKLLCP